MRIEDQSFILRATCHEMTVSNASMVTSDSRGDGAVNGNAPLRESAPERRFGPSRHRLGNDHMLATQFDLSRRTA
ncbi:hypothetical protein KDL45_19460, partial [bacterium]|nr:hypothetical protein [bacterium]